MTASCKVIFSYIRLRSTDVHSPPAIQMIASCEVIFNYIGLCSRDGSSVCDANV